MPWMRDALSKARKWTRVAASNPREGAGRLRNKVETLLPSPTTTYVANTWKHPEGFPGCDNQGGNDADSAFASAVWDATHTLRPNIVVETGVAHGITSALILQALENNGKGHLYSIDLPPLHELNVGQAVPVALRHRWTYLRGSSRQLLPRLERKLSSIDIFIHDSLHTYWTMRFEFSWALKHLRSGGLLLSDDIELNAAFDEIGGTAYNQSEKDGLFGIHAISS